MLFQSFPSQYNPSDAQDILRYAKWLIGKTFYDVLYVDSVANNKYVTDNSDVLEELDLETNGNIASIDDCEIIYGNKRRKGGLGNLIEEHFFHYKVNSNSDADFSLAELELKVTPYEERIGRGTHAGEKYYVAGERLVLTMIDYNQRPIIFDLFKSHLWQKCSQILLIYYLRNKLIDNLKYRIDFVDIFTPSDADLIIISKDYLFIMDKIAKGMAHEISESDTMYLGACTKGSTAEKSRVIQVENGISAQRRAFCFKTSYMTFVLNEYLINNDAERDSIVTDNTLLSELGFEGYLQSKINKFIGKTDQKICEILNLEYTGNKAQWINIAFAMLGIKSNKAEELRKANIVIKATRIESNDKIRENTSFPAFKFKDLIKEEWLEFDEQDVSNPSTLQTYFSSTKFLFVVFKKIDGKYVLKGCQLWNMPYYDLNVTVRQGWEAIKNVIEEGVKFSMKPVKSGNRVGKFIILNNLPGKHDNPIIHVRPHAQKAYYKTDDYEDGNPSDGNELPDGRWMTTQCFWLNNSYIISILRKDLR